MVIGASTGYGLSSLITTSFGHGARALGVCLERPPQGEKGGSAGWYNLAAATRRGLEAGHPIDVVNGDAYSTAVKAEVIARSAPVGRREARQRGLQPRQPAPHRSGDRTHVDLRAQAPGAAFVSKSINLGNDQVIEISLPPASDVEIAATTQVMGGEDWQLWMRALLAADLLAEGCRTVAYSYIGPELTYPIYRSGTIGKAKEHLENTARALHAELGDRVGGAAYVSVNKAVVTQASTAIPVVPLYISILYARMKAAGTHEGTIEQIARLFRDHLSPSSTPHLDAAGLIRLDDLELAPSIQSDVLSTWRDITTENLFARSDYAGFKQEFRALFGFDVPGVDYERPVELDVPLDALA